MNIQNTPSVTGNQTLRGIIIIDTCALFALTAGITPDLLFPLFVQQKAPSHLLDTIPFLGRNGYKIIVPEMVAYEAAQIIRGGDSLEPYFKKSKLAYGATVANFLQHSLSEGEVDILPPYDEDTSPAAIFIRKIWNIHKRNHTKASKHIELVLAQKNKKKDFGDIAACQYLRFTNPTSLPIFYLTDDWNASINAENIRTDLHVTSLSVYNFLAALYEQGVFPKIGINNYPPESFKPTLTANGQKQGETRSHFNDSKFYTNRKKRQLFADTLTGITDNSHNETNDPVIPLIQAVRPSDAKKKFLNRYGNIGRALRNN